MAVFGRHRLQPRVLVQAVRRKRRRHLPKKSAATGTTVPVSVCFKRGTREVLTHLSAIRKITGTARPNSIVGIIDEAVGNLAEIKGDSPARYAPVPREGCERVSLRISGPAYDVARVGATSANIRITDWLRTAVVLYLLKHEKELGPRPRRLRTVPKKVPR